MLIDGMEYNALTPKEEVMRKVHSLDDSRRKDDEEYKRRRRAIEAEEKWVPGEYCYWEELQVMEYEHGELMRDYWEKINFLSDLARMIESGNFELTYSLRDAMGNIVVESKSKEEFLLAVEKQRRIDSFYNPAKMTVRKIKSLMREMGYAYTEGSKKKYGAHGFYKMKNPERRVWFKTWAACEEWLLERYDFEKAMRNVWKNYHRIGR